MKIILLVPHAEISIRLSSTIKSRYLYYLSTISKSKTITHFKFFLKIENNQIIPRYCQIINKELITLGSMDQFEKKQTQSSFDCTNVQAYSAIFFGERWISCLGLAIEQPDIKKMISAVSVRHTLTAETPSHSNRNPRKRKFLALKFVCRRIWTYFMSENNWIQFSMAEISVFHQSVFLV